MLYLNVPYKEKDDARALGARWSPDRKKWYAPRKKDYPKFFKWLPREQGIIICDYIYIIEAIRICHKCKHPTKVIGFGFENYYEYGDEELDVDYYYHSGTIRIVSEFSPMPDKLFAYIQENYNYKMSYSRTIDDTYWANNCDFCHALQGNWFLFSEPDSVFYPQNQRDASKLKLYKISLPRDFVLDHYEGSSLLQYDLQMIDGFCCGKKTSLIKECATAIPLNIL